VAWAIAPPAPAAVVSGAGEAPWAQPQRSERGLKPATTYGSRFVPIWITVSSPNVVAGLARIHPKLDVSFIPNWMRAKTPNHRVSCAVGRNAAESPQREHAVWLRKVRVIQKLNASARELKV